ncbi:MAG: uroporphyrinogen-III synthase, partial [Pseudomonadota bacterium]
VLVTSGNAIRALANITDIRDMKIIAVGDNSMYIAKENNFTNVESAKGDTESLKKYVETNLKPKDGKLIYICGNHITDDLAKYFTKANYDIEQIILYEAIAAKKINAVVKSKIINKQVDIILFYSIRTAEIFVQLIKKDNLENLLDAVTAVSIIKQVAKEAEKLKFRDSVIADITDGNGMILRMEALLAEIKNSKNDKIVSDSDNKDDPINNIEKTHNKNANSQLNSDRELNNLDNEDTDNPDNKFNQMNMNDTTAISQNGPQQPDNLIFIMLIIVTWIILGGACGYGVFMLKQYKNSAINNESRIEILEKLTENFVYDSHLFKNNDTVIENEEVKILLDKLDKLQHIGEKENKKIRRDIEGLYGQKIGSQKDALENTFKAVVIQAQLQDIAERVNELEGTILSRISHSLHQNEMLISLVNLRETVDKNIPFSYELENCINLSDKEPMVKLLLTDLKAYSKKGIKDLDQLKNEFSAIIPQLIASNRAEGNGSVFDELKSSFDTVVTVRKINDVEGNSVDAIIARAELHFENNNLDNVVLEINKLNDAQLQLAATLLSDINAYIAVNNIFSNIYSYLTQEKNKIKEAMDVDPNAEIVND